MKTKRGKLHAKSFNVLLTILFTFILSGFVLAQANYQITISTGSVSNASTDADVRVKLKGTNGGESGWIKLDKKNYNDFEAGSIASYNLGRHDLRGSIMVAFYVSSNNTIDESWYLKSFRLRTGNRNSFQKSSYKTLNKWVHPGKRTGFYDSGLTNQQRFYQRPDNSTAITLVPQTDGTYIFKTSGNGLSNLNSNSLILVPQSNGTFVLKLAPKAANGIELRTTDDSLIGESKDDCTKFSLRRVSNNTFKVMNDCTGRFIALNNDKNNSLVVFNPQNGVSRPAVSRRVTTSVIFENRTNGKVDIYSIDERGVERFHRSLASGKSGFVQKNAESSRWIIRRNGNYLAKHDSAGSHTQRVLIWDHMTRTVRLDVQRP